MARFISTFSGFSVKDIAAAKEFYSTTLGLQTTDQMGGFAISAPGNIEVWVYEKADHEPAVYTCLNFTVDNIDIAVKDLVAKGIEIERYDSMPQDDNGIVRGKENNMGPNIAWFKDPSGNILSVIEQ